MGNLADIWHHTQEAARVQHRLLPMQGEDHG